MACGNQETEMFTLVAFKVDLSMRRSRYERRARSDDAPPTPLLSNACKQEKEVL